MKLSARLRPLCLPGILVPACLVLTACDPMDGPAPVKPVRYTAPPLGPGRVFRPVPESARWLAAWHGLKEEMIPLQEKLEGLREFHATHQLDEFLKLDPETLDKDQLSTMRQFLERGYFTVQRRILIDLLERRLERRAKEEAAATPPPAVMTLKDRFVAGMHQDELRMVDIERAIEYYSQAGTADIQLPNSLTDAEHEELLTSVNVMVERTRGEVTEMDAKIKSLRRQVYPDAFDDEPEPEEPVSQPEAEAAAPAPAPMTEATPEDTEPGDESGPSSLLLPAENPDSMKLDDLDDSSGETDPGELLPSAGPGEPPLPE